MLRTHTQKEADKLLKERKCWITKVNYTWRRIEYKICLTSLQNGLTRVSYTIADLPFSHFEEDELMIKSFDDVKSYIKKNEA